MLQLMVVNLHKEVVVIDHTKYNSNILILRVRNAVVISIEHVQIFCFGGIPFPLLSDILL